MLNPVQFRVKFIYIFVIYTYLGLFFEVVYENCMGQSHIDS
jgi:hypothetical protein